MTAIADSRSATNTVFTVLFAASACHMINDTLQAILQSIYPLLRDTYSLSFTQVGLITLIFQVVASVLQPLIGSLTDRKPMPYLLPLAPALTLTGFVLLATAPSYAMVLVAAALIGTGSSVFHPDASRVARLASGGRYGMAQSVFQVGGNVGTAIGPLLAAAIVIPRGQTSLLWFCALAVIAIVLLYGVGNWHSSHLATTARKAASKVSSYTQSQITLALTILLILMFSKFVYMASMHSFYIFYLIEHFNVSNGQAQVYLFVLLGAVAVGTYAGGPIGDRIGRKAVIWFSILGTLPFSLALPYANLFWTVVLTIPIGLIMSSAFSAMVVYAQELMPGRVGMISGLFFGIAFGMGGLGAAALGVLADHSGIDTVFMVCSVLPALGLLAFLLPKASPAQ